MALLQHLAVDCRRVTLCLLSLVRCWVASFSLTSAPSATLHRPVTPSARARRCGISTTRSGAAMPSRIQFSSSVPPARNMVRASAPAATAWSARISARVREGVHQRPPDRCRRLRRFDDLRIGRTAAQVATHPLADPGLAPDIALLDVGDRRHDRTRRAEAALEAVMVDEGLPHAWRCFSMHTCRALSFPRARL